MQLIRDLAESGRRIRVNHNRRQRLPCSKGWIVSGPDLSEFHEILEEELNVESIEVESNLDRFQKKEIQPNFRKLAPKARAEVNDVAAALRSIDDVDAFVSEIKAGKAVIHNIHIEEDDIEVRRTERAGFAADTLRLEDQQSSMSIVLDMNDTPELLSKGLA